MTLESRMKKAQHMRRAAMYGARALTDEEAAGVPTMFEEWNPAGVAVYDGEDGKHAVTRVRGTVSGLLYRCRESHTTQADWPPETTPALWAVIDVAHAGTMEDPVPASRGMEYEYGKYYLDPEDGKTYLCRRGEETGTVTLAYLPHELTGQYFEEADA